MTTTKGRMHQTAHRPSNDESSKHGMDFPGDDFQRDRRVSSLPAAELTFIRLNEVLSICGKSRSSVYEAIQKGVFPAPVKLCGRSSAWVKSEIMQWMETCIRESRNS